VDSIERRVCIYSQRGLSKHVSLCALFEFEDLIATQFETAADIIVPEHGMLSPFLLKARNRLSQKTPLFRFVKSGLDAPKLSVDYDLFVCVLDHARNLATLDALRDWRKRSAYAVCIIQEFWIIDVNRLGPLIEVLNSFDHVILQQAGTARILAEKLDVPVTYETYSTDTVLFCPYPQKLERVIEFCNISRMSKITHQALLQYSRETGVFYDYKTIFGKSLVRNPAEHRWRFSDRLKRSRYFFVQIAKAQRPNDRGMQEEIGLRYIEGIASGAVLLGDRPLTPEFEKHCGWTDSVIEVPYEYSDIARIAADLDRQPDRLAEARRQNVLNALSRHDHLHRWEQILKLADLPQTVGMAARRAEIANLSNMILADP
jgi:hypothetical protein